MNKILFVVPSFSGGGAERVVTVLASNLAERGFDVSCIIYYRAEKEYEYSDKIKVFNLTGGKEEDYRALNMKSKVLKLRNMITSIHPDYIIPFLPQVGFHVWLASLGKKYRIIQTVRNDPRNDPTSRFERLIRNLMLTFSWRNFVQNKEQLDYFPAFIKKKTSILPNPVPQSLFQMKHHYSSQVKNVISLGRLSKQKNFDLIIRTAARVHQQYPDIKFHIFGDGDLHDTLYQTIVNSNLKDCVVLEGRTDKPYEEMCGADIFVLSSNYEGMPNALLEAMALGMPSISTDCPTGPSDIIHNQVNGRLVPLDDDQAIADIIIEWVNDPQKLEITGENAKRTILDNYSADVISNKFLKEVLLFNGGNNN